MQNQLLAEKLKVVESIQHENQVLKQQVSHPISQNLVI